METLVWPVNRDNPELEVISKAAELLKEGKLVAFPTETVYGLGADMQNIQAVKQIYHVKKRSFSNPLALLIAFPEALKELWQEVPLLAYKLIEPFWPGALTLVYYKHSQVHPLITANSPKLGVRMPNHPVPLALLKELKKPVVATSANLSGNPSPNEAKQVLKDLGGKIDLLLDGGPTELQKASTVLDLTTSPPTIIREGTLSKEILADYLK
jgi:L-threonylcarbamoyladenylate synthase